MAAAVGKRLLREKQNAMSSRRTGRFGQSCAKSCSLDLLLTRHADMTSADTLFAAYPVHFSATAAGPWSGLDHYACLYSEQGTLFELLVSVRQTLRR